MASVKLPVSWYFSKPAFIPENNVFVYLFKSKPNSTKTGFAPKCAIDPAVAKNMLAYVLQYGISTSLDRMLRADIFPIHQMGVFAYDGQSKTSITNRATSDRPSKRNDTLEI